MFFFLDSEGESVVFFSFYEKRNVANIFISVLCLYQNEEVHGGAETDDTAGHVDDGSHVKALVTEALHDDVVAVVGEQIKKEDYQKMIGGSWGVCSSPSEDEAKSNVDQTVQ